jgi:hypothetical protein
MIHLRRFLLGFAALGLFVSPALTVPQTQQAALAFASQAFFAAGGASAVTLAARFGYLLRPEDFGAAGNGTTDDTVAIQKWLNALISSGGEGTCKGAYRLTSGVNGFAASNPYHVHGAGETCKFYIDFSGWGLAGIDLTNPSSPTSSNRGQPVEFDHVKFAYNPALTAPPIAFRDRYATNLYLHDIDITQYTGILGTALQISDAWNSRIREIQVWGAGGFRANHLVNAATTFSISSGSTTLTASQSEFVSSDVGSSITLAGTGANNGDSEQFVISSYTSGASVTVSRAASFAHSAENGAFSGVMGSMSAGSSTLTLSNARLTSADIGRVVYVQGAGSVYNGAAPLRATITAVSGASITLSASATTAVSNVELIIDPAVDIFEDADVSGVTNDFSSLNLHLEENSGVSLLVQACGFCTFSRSKIEIDVTGTPWGSTDLTGQAQAVFFGAAAVDGIINGAAVSSVGQMWVQDVGTTFTVGHIDGGATTGQPAISMMRNSTNSLMTIGDRGIGNNVAPVWLPSLYYSDGSSALGATTVGNVVAYNTGQSAAVYAGRVNVGSPGWTGSAVNIMAPTGANGALALLAPSGSTNTLRIFAPGSATANGAISFNSSLGFQFTWGLFPQSGGGSGLGSPAYYWTGVYSEAFIASGSAPTNSGSCAINTQLGGNTAGSFKANGACSSGTILLTFATTAPNGWTCAANDLTTTADTIKQTAYTTTTASFAATMAASDLASFSCTAF